MEKVVHWTEELFLNNPTLFLGHLKGLTRLANGEVRTILKLLDQHAFRYRRILDLNCGIGRHSMVLARLGIEVVGTDISPAYIKIAKQRALKNKLADKVKFKEADMRNIARVLTEEQIFDGVFCLWTSFGFYDDETNDDILHQCLRLVTPGGFFVLDIINRDWLLRHFSERGFTKTKSWLVLEERRFDHQNSKIYNDWLFFKKTGEKGYSFERSLQIDLRVWSLHELVTLFNRTGWEYRITYPGFSKNYNFRDIDFDSQLDNLLGAGRFLVIASRPE